MLARGLFAALAAALGVVPVGYLAMLPAGLLMLLAATLRRRLSPTPGPHPDPDADPTPAEHTEVAITFGLATLLGVPATLLGGWAAFPSMAPHHPHLCALVPALLAASVAIAGVRMIPAAAGFSVLPAVVPALLTAASVSAATVLLIG